MTADSISGMGLSQLSLETSGKITVYTGATPQGQGQLFDQRGSCDQLFGLGELGLLVNVNDLQVITAFEMFLTEGPDVLDGAS